MSNDLQGHRAEIDRIDDQILRLLNERSKSVIEIGKLKKQKDAEAHLHTPAREAAIIERLGRQNTGPFPTEAIRAVYREIMSASLSLEGPRRWPISVLVRPSRIWHARRSSGHRPSIFLSTASRMSSAR